MFDTDFCDRLIKKKPLRKAGKRKSSKPKSAKPASKAPGTAPNARQSSRLQTQARKTYIDDIDIESLKVVEREAASQRLKHEKELKVCTS
jgi:hypothetical protein